MAFLCPVRMRRDKKKGIDTNNVRSSKCLKSFSRRNDYRNKTKDLRPKLEQLPNKRMT